MKKTLFSIGLAILIGYILGKIVSNIYSDQTLDYINNSKVYLLQVATSNTLDELKAKTPISNYIYYNDEGIYKSVIAITSNYNNIATIKDLYNNFDIVVEEYYISEENILQQITEYDNQLVNENDRTKQLNIITKTLAIYKETTNNTLSKQYY